MRHVSTFAVVAALALLAVAAPAAAQGPSTDPVVAPGVTVAGVEVGGLTAVEAEAALRAFFDRPVELALGGESPAIAPEKLGASADISHAVAAALSAAPNKALELKVKISEGVLRKWLRHRAKRFNTKPVSTHAVLVNLRPRLTKPRPGRMLVRKRAYPRLVKALRTHGRAVKMPVKLLRPAVTPGKHGPAIVIRRDSKRLILYRAAGAGPMTVAATFPIATGMAAYPTPLGNFRIAVKQRNPWWYPPKSAWAAGAKPIPPGPGNPLGTRWMGLTAGSVGIHGTPDAASIGYSASHGCIRMRIANAEWLFERVRVGTPVFIVGA